MSELEKAGEIFLVVVPILWSWIKAAMSGDATASRNAMFATANAIADTVERQRFGGGNG